MGVIFKKKAVLADRGGNYCEAQRTGVSESDMFGLLCRKLRGPMNSLVQVLVEPPVVWLVPSHSKCYNGEPQNSLYQELTPSLCGFCCRKVLGAVFVERVVGAETGERLSRGVRQPQQDVSQPNLPERDASRLEQLQPAGPVELWLSAR